MERTIWQWQELTKTRKLGWIDMDPVVCKKLTDAMQDLGDEDYTYPRPLARSILGPGAVYMPPWASQEGVYTAPWTRMGLARGRGYV